MKTPCNGLKGLFLHLFICVLVILSGCSPSGSSGDSGASGNTDGNQDPLSLNLAILYSTCLSITVHVAYEPDAVPYTGAAGNGIQYWSILEMNLGALFSGRLIKPVISVPMDLTGMEQIPEQGLTSWTREQIIALASGVEATPQTSTSAELYAFFINGYFTDEDGTNRDIIGISLGGTPVVVVFKDVFAHSGYTQTTNSFMEQAVLVHEFGHCMGLVNNGIPMASNHEDLQHKHHCMNNNCVMYWENERESLVFFIHQIMSAESDILFDAACLDDVTGYHP